MSSVERRTLSWSTVENYYFKIFFIYFERHCCLGGKETRKDLMVLDVQDVEDLNLDVDNLVTFWGGTISRRPWTN